ncbi:MAG: hypothetical protein ACK4FR_11950 [Tabrizicola sp.]
MKVIHRSDQLLVIEDRPWFIGLALIAMTLVSIFGGLQLVASGKAFGGMVLLLLGAGVPLVIAALMVRRVRLTFDRSERTLTRVSRSVRGLTRHSYALERLQSAQLGVSTDSDGSTWRTELRLSDPAETVLFTDYYTSGCGPERMVDVVNDWLTQPR